MSSVFLNEKIVLSAIVINTLFMYVGGFLPNNVWFESIDVIFTVFFLLEAIVKIHNMSFKKYWQEGWNKFDFIIVLFALPSILDPFIEGSVATHVLFAFRTLRVFKSFKLFKFVPNISKILKGIKLAIKSSVLVCLAYIVFLIVFSILTSSLFGKYAPEYFGDPIISMYSVFRLFTVEGWYDMPDAVVANGGQIMGAFSRIYFAILLFVGGILGMSLVNSIFVDAMVSDNNDDVLKKLDEIEKEIKKLNNNK